MPLIATVASALTALFPGIGPTQASVILKAFFKDIGRRSYLVMVGAMNTGNLVFSLLMLFAFEKGRTGMAVAISNFLKPDFTIFMLLIAAAFLSDHSRMFTAGKIKNFVIWILEFGNYAFSVGILF